MTINVTFTQVYKIVDSLDQYFFCYRVMTTLCFNSVEIDPFINKGMSIEEQRVRDIICIIQDYGVDPKYIFKPDDVLKKKNPQKVIRTLEEVAKLVRNSG